MSKTYSFPFLALWRPRNASCVTPRPSPPPPPPPTHPPPPDDRRLPFLVRIQPYPRRPSSPPAIVFIALLTCPLAPSSCGSQRSREDPASFFAPQPHKFDFSARPGFRPRLTSVPETLSVSCTRHLAVPPFRRYLSFIHVPGRSSKPTSSVFFFFSANANSNNFPVCNSFSPPESHSLPYPFATHVVSIPLI